MMARNLIFMGTLCAVAALATVAEAQVHRHLPEGTRLERVDRDFPVVRLSYYAGFEGNTWQELADVELKDWTSQKDVVITSKWLPRSGATSPGARSPGQPRTNDPRARRRMYRPIHRVWVVTYIDAVEEGESHIFIDAAGLPRISERIYGAEDVIAFHHFPGQGWRQLGKAARALRNRPAPFHTQPPATQNPPGTSSPSDVRSR